MILAEPDALTLKTRLALRHPVYWNSYMRLGVENYTLFALSFLLFLRATNMTGDTLYLHSKGAENNCKVSKLPLSEERQHVSSSVLYSNGSLVWP